MATLDDVAALSRVSAMTVSRVVNNKPGVSAKTIAKVEAAIQALNYRPNLVARSLVTNRVDSVGVLFSRLENPQYSVMVSGIVQTAARCGLDVVLGNGHDMDSLLKSVNTLISKQIDGLIVLPVEVSAEDGKTSAEDTLRFYAELERILSEMPTGSLPTVLLEDSEIRGISGRVRVDYRGGAKMAVNYLVENGHRKIGMVRHTVKDAGIWRERYLGFLEAMEENHCPIVEEYIASSSHSVSSGFEAGLGLLSRQDRPTAVYCANDEIAVGVRNAAAACGLRVPEDISIIGHDGSLYSETTYPRLTTVSIRSFDMGKACMEQLYGALNGKKMEPVRTIEPVLIPGGSVRKLSN
ncbi:MAG: LacI family DNA-binding transcriptional regulator [Firmicutes bacterium]|nr:LacI family DNA-binding transcriptional regulator [Bacillota bacterium]